MMGLAGEEHVPDDRTVWLTKTHWPSPAPPFPEREFWIDRSVVLVRNPIDVFASMFLFINTGSHSMTCTETINEAFPREWDEWIRCTVAMFKEYHTFVLDTLRHKVPVFFFRYEDKTTRSTETLSEMFRFIMNKPSIEGTILQQRINKVTADSHTHEKRTYYRLKSFETLNRNISLYNKQQLDLIKSELKDFLYFFGYVNNEQDKENHTAFFNFDHD
jgi:hypothetical protein